MVIDAVRPDIKIGTVSNSPSNLLHLKSIMLLIVACSSKNDFFFQKHIKFIPDKVFDNFKESLLSRFTAGIDQFYHLVIFVLLNSSKEDLCALSL